jgi:hypothetical protein
MTVLFIRRVYHERKRLSSKCACGGVGKSCRQTDEKRVS